MAYFTHRHLSEGVPINITFPVTTSDNLMLRAMTTKINTAPTTSEDLVLTLISAEPGANYDTVIYRVDLAAASTTDDINTGIDLPLVRGDTFKLTYLNTDGRTIGIRVIMSSGG